MKSSAYKSLWGFIGGFVSVTCLVGVALVAPFAVADAQDTRVGASVTVTASCSFRGGGGIYPTEILNGNYGVVVGDPIVTSCNDNAGYAIYAIGYSSDSYTAADRTDMISSAVSTNNIKTDGSNFGSYWRMKLGTPVDATIVGSFGEYHNIPSVLTKVASYSGATTVGSVTPSYYINIGDTQPAGTYTGKVKYILLHPSTTVAGNITVVYNANGGTGNAVTVNNVPNYDSYTLVGNDTTVFTAPAGYYFGGWCTTNTAGPYACDGDEYDAGEEVTSLASNGQTVNLYAIWSQYIQDLTTPVCQTLASSDSLTVYDRRDGSDYTVRYINGQCWMTQNLRISGIVSGTYSNFEGNSINLSQYDLKEHGSDECQGTNGEGLGMTNICSHVPDSTDLASIGGGITSKTVGAWYNYCAATAGTICDDYTTIDATSDICPAGWHLPTGPNTTNGTNFNTLIGNNVSGWQLPTTGLTNFDGSRGGTYDNGSLTDVNYGHWWSASSNLNSTRRVTLFRDGGNTKYAGNYVYARHNGYFIRCVRD